MTRLERSFVTDDRTREQDEAFVTSTARSLIPLLSWLGALAAAIAILIMMGKNGLHTPSVLDPTAWPAWVSGQGPLDAAFAILRLVGLAGAWYLLGVTTIGMMARLLRWGRLVDFADVLTVPWVRNLLQAALGVGLATAAVTSTTMGPGALDASPGVAVEAPVHGAVVPVSMLVSEPAMMRQLPPAITGEAPAHEAPAPEASAGGTPAGEAPAPGNTYEVQPGDHLWSIAERTLADAWGRAPSEDEVLPFLQQLVEMNRGGLVDPGNPDLILPGQTLTVPAPPAVS
jgi:LysM domain